MDGWNREDQCFSERKLLDEEELFDDEGNFIYELLEYPEDGGFTELDIINIKKNECINFYHNEKNDMYICEEVVKLFTDRKAIVVIDMPEYCMNCPCCSYSKPESMIVCKITNKNTCSTGKPDWCPLKKLPLKQDESKFDDEYENGYVNGWNSCIKKITE